MAERVAESLFNGSKCTQEFTDEVALRCEIIKDIEDIEASDINEFYQPATEKENPNGKI